MKTIKIGRGTNNDVVINDGVVSTFHATITISDFGEITIEDQNSKNGTFVNGKRIKKEVLTSASTVLLGNHSIDWKQIVQNAQVYKSKPVKSSISIPSDIIEKKLIGRSPMSQLRFSFDDVSDKHAYLCKNSKGDIIVVDNNSTNGTYVNGSRITAPHTLNKGDILTISNKHPLNWDVVYPQKRNFNLRTIVPISISIIAILILAILFIRPNGNKEWSVIFAEHKNDVVLIYVKSAYAVTVQGYPLSSYLNGNNELDYLILDESGKISSGIARSSGTGFFISNDGKMLTNRHVVSCPGDQKKNEDIIKETIQALLYQNGMNKLAANVEVNYKVISVGIVQNDTYIDNESNLIPCTIIRTSDNKDLDVAIIQTNSKSLPLGSTFVDLEKSAKTEDLSLGYEICTIGFPQSFIIGQTSVGLEANNQSGAITQIRGAYEYGHNITIHQGASGSPVYNKKGEFSGIIVSGFLGISQGYNHAITPNPVIEFVKKEY